MNDEGWIVTSSHILEQLNTLNVGAQTARNIEAQRSAIQGDTAISPKDKRRRLLAIKKPKKNDTEHSSA